MIWLVTHHSSPMCCLAWWAGWWPGPLCSRSCLVSIISTWHKVSLAQDHRHSLLRDLRWAKHKCLLKWDAWAQAGRGIGEHRNLSRIKKSKCYFNNVLSYKLSGFEKWNTSGRKQTAFVELPWKLNKWVSVWKLYFLFAHFHTWWPRCCWHIPGDIPSELQSLCQCKSHFQFRKLRGNCNFTSCDKFIISIPTYCSNFEVDPSVVHSVSVPCLV